MPSIGSYLKQSPLNNGFFRTMSATITSDCSSMYTLAVNTATGFATSATAVGANPSFYNGLLRDMGVQYKGAPGTAIADLIYRRVQIVPAASDVGGSASTPAADTDYGVYYIIIGRDGADPASPFVRTG